MSVVTSCKLYLSAENFVKLTPQYSEYDHTKQIFVNSYPWLFPGGVGDIYDMERGEVPIEEWGQHLLRYFYGWFLDDSLFGLSLYNTIQRHTNNKEGNFFFNSDRFIGENSPTVQELKKQLRNKDTKYINMLRHFSRNIKGGDNFWRSKTEDLKHWITHHVARGHYPQCS